MKISRKLFRDFMQDVMRSKLIEQSNFTRYSVLRQFMAYTQQWELSIDDEIDFFNALKDFGKDFIFFGENREGERRISFYADPVNRDDWAQFVNSIYQEA